MATASRKRPNPSKNKNVSGASVASGRATKPARVTHAAQWRDGVHLIGTEIWADATRAGVVNFLSTAAKLAKREQKLIATPTALAIARQRNRGNLAVPPNTSFTLGTLRLELFSTGSAIGSAGLRVDFGKRSVVFAGAVQPATVGLLGLGDAVVRRCDALVVDAPAATLAAKLIAPGTAAATIGKWLVAKHQNDISVIVVDDGYRGLDVLNALGGLAKSVALVAPSFPQPKKLPANIKSGDRTVVLVQRTAIDKMLRSRLGKNPLSAPRVLWVSAEAGSTMAVRTLKEQLSCDVKGLAWSAVAAVEDLLTWVADTGATAVYVTGSAAADVVRLLGPKAKRLGPAEQMSLFR
jgi:hypothetical protein